ncbi:MAG: AarF/UbiB family protein [Cetobacterium sp.]
MVYTFTFKMLKLLHTLDLNEIPDNKFIKELDFFGVQALEYYSSRIDIMDVDVIYQLLSLYNNRSRGEKNDLIKSLNRKIPLLFNLEYFDDEPFEVSETSNFFKGVLKSRVYVSIKVLRKNKEEILKNISSLERLESVSNYVPGIDISKNLKSFTDFCNNSMSIEYDLKLENENLLKLKEKKELFLTKYPELEHLKFSKSFPYLSEPDVWVSEFIENGRPLSIALRKNLLKKDAALNIIRTRLIYALEIGIFTSNLSDKDIVVEDDDNFYFRNCYRMIEITDIKRKILLEFLEAILDGDSEKSIIFLTKLSETTLSEEKFIIFKEDATIFLNENFKNHKTVSIVKLMCNLLKIALDNSLVFEKYIYDFFKELMFIQLIVFNSGYKIEFFSILNNFIKSIKSTDA